MAGTFTITSANVGQTIDVQCLLVSLTYNTAPLIYEPPQTDAITNLPSKGVFCLTDADHPIFNLNTFTNSSFPPVGGQPPAGQAINIGSGLVVGKLVVRSCPVGATWTAVTEAAPPGTIFPNWTKGSSVFDPDPAVSAQRQRDAAILAEERIRTARPPPTSLELMQAAGIEVVPPPEPPPPDPLLVEASRKARKQVAAEAAARARAKGPTICGRSQAEIETELLVVAQAQQQADWRSVEESNARAAAGQRLVEQRAADQAAATALLEKARRERA
jgi:hypothetical protein